MQAARPGGCTRYLTKPGLSARPSCSAFRGRRPCAGQGCGRLCALPRSGEEGLHLFPAVRLSHGHGLRGLQAQASAFVRGALLCGDGPPALPWNGVGSSAGKVCLLLERRRRVGSTAATLPTRCLQPAGLRLGGPARKLPGEGNPGSHTLSWAGCGSPGSHGREKRQLPWASSVQGRGSADTALPATQPHSPLGGGRTALKP